MHEQCRRNGVGKVQNQECRSNVGGAVQEECRVWNVGGVSERNVEEEYVRNNGRGAM